MSFHQFIPVFALIGVLILLLLHVAWNYRKTHNKVFILLGLSLLSFLLSNVIVLFTLGNAGPPSPGSEAVEEAFFRFSSILYTILFMIVGLLFLIFFFQAFRQETIYTKRNIVLIVFTTLLFGLGEVNLIYLQVILIDHPDFFQLLDQDQVSSELPYLPIVVFFASLLIIAMSVIFAIYLGMRFVHEVRTSLNRITNPSLKPTAMRMKYSVYVMAVTAIFPGSGPGIGPFGDIMTFIFIAALISFAFFYNQGGIFFLQGDDLKRLIIINPSGLPVYSYSFWSFKDKQEQSLIQQENEEILFTGALQSISMLLSEFAGGNQNVTEIRLEDLIMVVETFKNGSSSVLMVQRSSPFVEEALTKFNRRISNLVNDMKRDKTFSTNEVKFANSIVEDVFGQKTNGN